MVKKKLLLTSLLLMGFLNAVDKSLIFKPKDTPSSDWKNKTKFLVFKKRQDRQNNSDEQAQLRSFGETLQLGANSEGVTIIATRIASQDFFWSLEVISQEKLEKDFNKAPLSTICNALKQNDLQIFSEVTFKR